MSENNQNQSNLKSFLIILVLVVIFTTPFLFNKDNENSLDNNNIITSNPDVTNSKTQINHESGEIFEDNNDINKETISKENKDNNKIYTTYTKKFVDLAETSDEQFLYSENGHLFGWEERLFDGCSSWCSVSDYNVNVNASSTLKPHGKYSYSASNVQDLNRENAWVEGTEGNGIGEYIEIEQNCLIASPEYKTDIGFTELCIVNGYAATEKNWAENNRVKEFKMYFNDKYITTIVLEDTIKQQYIDISQFNLKVQNGETAKFKFEINDVYEGTKYDDTCVTGLLIEFSGRTGH